MEEDLEEVRIKTPDAIRLIELARISALTQTEFNGIIYGVKRNKKFYVKGIIPVYERANDCVVDNNRTEIYLKMFKKANPHYSFFTYHSHTDGSSELSEYDIEVIDGLEILLSSKTSFSGFLRKKLSKVGYGMIKAYNVIEKNGKKESVEVPIRIEHTHKL